MWGQRLTKAYNNSTQKHTKAHERARCSTAVKGSRGPLCPMGYVPEVGSIEAVVSWVCERWVDGGLVIGGWRARSSWVVGR